MNDSVTDHSPWLPVAGKDCERLPVHCGGKTGHWAPCSWGSGDKKLFLPQHGNLPIAWRQAWQELLVYSEKVGDELLPVAKLLAGGLAEQLVSQLALNADRGGDLRTTIELFIRFHRSQPLQIGDLAEHLGRSVSRTGAIVRELFACTFSALLRQARIDGAKNLLRDPHLKITDVAQSMGFDDPLYFSRCFRAETGLSPKAWRASLS